MLLVFLLSVVQSAVSIKFYIMLSLNSECLGELAGDPCLTLQQYVSYQSHSSNTTLEFESGHHILKSSLSFYGGNYVGLTARGNATVECSDQSVIQLTFSSVTQVGIKGITFIHCGQIQIQYSTNVSVVRSNFFETLGSYSLYIYRSRSNILIEFCTFANNTRGRSLYLWYTTARIISSTFNDNRYNDRTIYIYSTSSSSLFITQSKFKNNTGGNGGVIYFRTSSYSQSYLTLDECSFISNTASSNGGAVYVSDGYRSATIECSRNTFRDNRAHRDGGALYVTGSTGTEISITGSLFVNNTSQDDGGAVYLTGNNRVTSNGNSFINNKAIDDGGAVYLTGSNRVTSNGNSFINNKASDDGGAMYVSGNSIHEYNTFTNNRANNGGAMFANGQITSSGSNFTNNIANVNGGAIYLSTSYASATTTGNNFLNNRAKSGSGGAIYTSNSGLSFTSNDSTFVNNVGYSGGGALYMIGYQASLTVIGSIFVNNLITGPDGKGGAVNVANTNVQLITFDASVFVNNSVTNGSGGAVYTKRPVSITNTIFGHNKAPRCAAFNLDQSNSGRSMFITLSTFLHNTAIGSTTSGNLGGVGCIRNAEVSVLHCTFSHNSAAGDGGVLNIEGSMISIEGSTFINNSAGVDGGVFCTHISPSNYMINESRFVSNRAGDDGGVLYLGRRGSFAAIDGNSFLSNLASDRGGAIAIFGSSMYMGNTNMKTNMASKGDDISACNSNYTSNIRLLNAHIDSIYPVCTLYDGTIQVFPEPAPHDNSNIDVVVYFQSFIHGLPDPIILTLPTTDISSTTGTEVDPLLKEIENRLFGMSVIIYLLFAIAIISAVILIIAIAMKCVKNSKNRGKKQVSHSDCATNQYDVEEVYDEPEWRTQGKTNTIPLKVNAGYSATRAS